jgi:hypothetical protein
VITTIWLVALYVGGSVMGGENPTADEEIYGTVLIVILGSVATGVYLLVRETRMKTKTGRLSLSTSGAEETTTRPQGRRSSAWWGLVDVAVVLALWLVGYQIARLFFSETASESVGALLPLAFLLVRQVRRSRLQES